MIGHNDGVCKKQESEGECRRVQGDGVRRGSHCGREENLNDWDLHESGTDGGE